MSGRMGRCTTGILDRPSSFVLDKASVCSQCRRSIHHRYPAPLAYTYYNPPRRRTQSSWAVAAQAAKGFFEDVDPKLPGGVKIDPFRTIANELKFLTKNMRQLIGSGHPVLDTVAKYYTQADGKHVRPTLVLLMSQATVNSPKSTAPMDYPSQAKIDKALSPDDVLEDVNPAAVPSLTSQAPVQEEPSSVSNILPSQRRLAEITELIHTASLLHDDVIDTSVSRRGSPSVNIAFGNKMAVLAGDFLLGRASVALARLRNSEVTELLATVIANLIEGEFMQLRNTLYDEAKPTFHPTETISYYLQKTYLKSASLISKSCRAAALLGNNTPEVVEAAYLYGKNLGLSFQLVDDMLDYSSASGILGKPAGADLELGLATAPLLFAWRTTPELGELVGRKFAAEGDVVKAREIVTASDGIEQTRALAQEYADKAVEAIAGFPDSEAKTGLEEMCVKVMQRKK